jgi:hypothetical protein
VQRLITELSALRDRYAELDSSSQSAGALSMKVARDLSQQVESFNSCIEDLRSRRDKLVGGNTQFAHMSVTDGADMRLQKLWIDLKQLVLYITVCRFCTYQVSPNNWHSL